MANTPTVYLVNNLIRTQTGMGTNVPIYGWGLAGGNGAVVMTGGGSLAAPDVLARELGHNLGLPYVVQPRLSVSDPTVTSPAQVNAIGSPLTFRPAALPKPSSLLLLTAGLVAIGLVRRRSR